jgi:putative transposase
VCKSINRSLQNKDITIKGLCLKLKMSRQNYYAHHKARQKKSVNKSFIIELVKDERKVQSRLGGRKVLHNIKTKLEKNKASIGRDCFFDILRENNMLISRKKSLYPKTTNSRHVLPVFHNEVKNIDIKTPNTAWCSDITYIRTDEGFMYAAIITDMCSRKIVGAHIGDSLESFGCVCALEKALSDLPSGKFPIHHSDRGTQYCCHEYVNRLKKRDLTISMTEENHCYENAIAERVNGILKQEYELDNTFRTKEHAVYAFYQAINLYNTRRPHMSLNYQYPSEVHKKAA